MTKLFVEQPLASPGSGKNISFNTITVDFFFQIKVAILNFNNFTKWIRVGREVWVGPIQIYFLPMGDLPLLSINCLG